ncbi:hypothetical protein [uncultured Clostridium sp.]|uniref:hypothetical protein n=1 Tax=uncultured Clostridium sp. TaxID=59620 RepID=UPI0028E1885A|nr:hypothetical protein [uncultured Clostridium sp.]
MYYSGGLYRNFPENKSAKSFEFTTVEDVAFIILDEDSAEKIAETVGGVVIPKENTVKEVGKLQLLHDKYIRSRDDMETEVFNSINEVYKNNRNNALKKTYYSQNPTGILKD